MWMLQGLVILHSTQMFCVENNVRYGKCTLYDKRKSNNIKATHQFQWIDWFIRKHMRHCCNSKNLRYTHREMKCKIERYLSMSIHEEKKTRKLNKRCISMEKTLLTILTFPLHHTFNIERNLLKQKQLNE